MYFPDFWCPNLNKYFEVKGWLTDSDKLKMKYIFSHYNNIEMIFLEDIKKYEKQYGELAQLEERRNHNPEVIGSTPILAT